MHSVGNSTALQETCLVEAFNLKSAIEFKLNKFTYARDALKDMPPRSEEELDAVTLHNQVRSFITIYFSNKRVVVTTTIHCCSDIIITLFPHIMEHYFIRHCCTLTKNLQMGSGN